LIVAVTAVDTGAAIATDVQGSGAATYVSVTDSQNNSLITVGDSPNLYGDRTNGKSFFVGIYYMNLNSGKVSGAADTVTFTFTPISSSSNCVVGIVAYEMQGFYSNGTYEVVGTPSDTAATAYAGENGMPGAYPGVFPPRVVGDITTLSLTYGSFDIVCAAATTTDGSTFNVGSENAYDPYGQGPVGELGWSLDGSQAAHVNGTYVTLAVQSEFLTGTAVENPCEFGNTPSSSDGISSVACAMGFATANDPLTYSISGNAGVASAEVAYSGTSSGSVTANGSGNFTISGLSAGSYTITPTLAGYTFSPISQNETISSSNITSVNFTATATAGAWSQPDCRNYGNFPNTGENIQGTVVYSYGFVDSRKAGAPVDSRTAGAPTDCRVSPNIPENSRTAPPFD